MTCDVRQSATGVLIVIFLDDSWGEGILFVRSPYVRKPCSEGTPSPNENEGVGQTTPTQTPTLFSFSFYGKYATSNKEFNINM